MKNQRKKRTHTFLVKTENKKKNRFLLFFEFIENGKQVQDEVDGCNNWYLGGTLDLHNRTVPETKAEPKVPFQFVLFTRRPLPEPEEATARI